MKQILWWCHSSYSLIKVSGENCGQNIFIFTLYSEPRSKGCGTNELESTENWDQER